uniref:Uncharacterized protein n=1 Tax=Meloidogyne enterolobii TaxID=390850 RepID=A0A6V7V4Z6_MELEN|nr:unnamed protein product [Meloidogyne enterolobii]
MIDLQLRQHYPLVVAIDLALFVLERRHLATKVLIPNSAVSTTGKNSTPKECNKSPANAQALEYKFSEVVGCEFEI